MTEEDTDASGSKHHQFHSPLNSNAVVTVAGGKELLTVKVPSILKQFFIQYVILCATEEELKIKFINKDDASNLQKRLEQLDDDTMRISIEYDALTHPGNIYVRGLSPELNTQDLHKLFEPFGEITSCKIVTDEFGRSKGYGFVNFSTGESAEDAIEKLNGMLVNGTKLYLNHHIAKKERLERLDFERANFTNLYIKSIPESMTEEELRKMFEVYGEISSVFIPEVKPESQSQGKRFGFVNMKTHEAAVKAMEELHGKELEDGSTLGVSRAQRRDERNNSTSSSTHQARSRQLSMSLSPTPLPVAPMFVPPPATAITSPPPQTALPVTIPLPGPHQQQSNLYVKNLAPTVDDRSLFDAFAPFGIIVSARTMTTEDGLPRGYGFVCFKTLQEAANALMVMNGSLLHGEVIHVSYAQRNNKRSKGQYSQNGFYPNRAPPPPPQFYYATGPPQNYVPMMPPPPNTRPFVKRKPKQQQLGTQIATLPTIQDKRQMFINTLIIPLIAERSPALPESKLWEKSDELMDELLEKYQSKGLADQQLWIEMCNDWTNHEVDNGLAELLQELNL